MQHAVFAAVNFAMYVAGWLEGGLIMGYEKFGSDAGQADMLSEYGALVMDPVVDEAPTDYTAQPKRARVGTE
jgi:trimethylamine:corrinoid methyltransferase-like protein